jgi:hypothetical protein
MSIFERRRPEPVEHIRDMTAILRAAEQPERIEIEHKIASMVQDTYGVRRAPLEDIKLAEEFDKLVEHIDDLVAGARRVYDSLATEAAQLKAELQARGADLVARIEQDKAVAEAYRQEFAEIRQRVKTRLDVGEQASNGEQQ